MTTFGRLRGFHKLNKCREFTVIKEWIGITSNNYKWNKKEWNKIIETDYN
jgi:hypothetical protein